MLVAFVLWYGQIYLYDTVVRMCWVVVMIVGGVVVQVQNHDKLLSYIFGWGFVEVVVGNVNNIDKHSFNNNFNFNLVGSGVIFTFPTHPPDQKCIIISKKSKIYFG